jgi:uncharacterized protein (TIGR00661 family)
MRSGALLADLAARHELHVFAGGCAFDALERRFSPLRIPHLEYVYQGSRISWSRTLARNAGLVIDLATRGTTSQIIAGRLEALALDLVVSDSEPFLLRAARALRIPVVSLDHVGVIAHCGVDAPWCDRPRLALDRCAYLALLGGADRVIISSFFQPREVPGHVEIVPPILRDRVVRAQPTAGDHLLVYFNAARWLTPELRVALAGLGRPVVVYGSGKVGRDGNAVHRPIDEGTFIDDLASCRAVLATGGHQLISEAIHLGKPMLLCPEATAEQRLNVREAERLGIARRVSHRDLTAAGLRRLFDEAAPLRKALAAAPPPSGEHVAIAALERTAPGSKLAGPMSFAVPSLHR